MQPEARPRAIGACPRTIAPTVVAAVIFSTVAAAGGQAQTLPGEQFEEIIDSAVRTGVPGVVLRVETWDGAIWSGAAGTTELEYPEPLTPDMPFRLYDMSKMAVAALALILVDDARFGLDDRIGKWIDPALIQNLPYASEVTIRDLIAQTSGIRDYFDEPFVFITRADPGRKWTPEELIAQAADGDAFAAPGTEVSYDSNTNTVLLGLAIEKAGGAPLAAQLQERLFQPLGMTATRSWEDAGAPSPVHGHVPQFFHRIDVSDFDLSMAWGAGGLISTAEDVSKMTRGVFEGKLLSSDSRALMTRRFRPLSDEAADYGYGTMRFSALDPAPIGHAGRGAGFGTVTAWWPQSGLIVVVLTNLEVESYFGILDAVARAVSEN
jgi:D-alanyl-D-alanine carboxypeptidase